MGKAYRTRHTEDYDAVVGSSSDKIINMLEEQYTAKLSGLKQWSTSDDHCFFPTGTTKPTLPPGFYAIKTSIEGLYFEKISQSTEGLLRFPDSNAEAVIDNITKFWLREELFTKYDLAYKRGILLYGPPGSGKTCCVKILCNDIIQQGGIIIDFKEPTTFSEGLRKLRVIQPETPIIVIIEDIDSIIDRYSESEVLNILDGVERLNRIVFISTTNYPERLGGRIINRPSRFDKRYLIGHPNPESRKMYLEFIAKDYQFENIDKWIEDTEGFSLAHIKELFVGVVILGDSYKETLEQLKDMNETCPDSSKFDKQTMGFLAPPSKKYVPFNGCS